MGWRNIFFNRPLPIVLEQYGALCAEAAVIAMACFYYICFIPTTAGLVKRVGKGNQGRENEYIEEGFEHHVGRRKYLKI